MIKLTRYVNKTSQTKEVTIYEKWDVDNGLFTEEYAYWKDLTPESTIKWGMSDDGYIGEVVHVRRYKVNKRSKKFNVHVRLTIGNSYVNKYSKILFDQNFKYNSFESIKPGMWYDRLARANKTKQLVQITAKMILRGSINYKIIGKMFRPDHAVPEATGRRFVKMPKIKRMIMEEIDRILEDRGLTKEFIAESTKKMIEMAISQKDMRGGAKLLEIAGKWLSLEAPKTKITRSESVSTQVVEQIEGAISKHKLTKQLTMEGNNNE